MKKLTLSRAKELIKRELGISASVLTRPSDMNCNPEFPRYELHLGNQHIEVYTKDVEQGKFTDKMVALSITHENSYKGVTEYFYSDTLKYSAPYTEWQNREVFCETMDDPQSDITLCRLNREAQDDCWKHFHVQRTQPEELSYTDILNNYGAYIKKVIFQVKHKKLKTETIRFAISYSNKILEHLSSYASEHPENESNNYAIGLQKDELVWLKELEQKSTTGLSKQEQQNNQSDVSESPESDEYEPEQEETSGPEMTL